MTSSPGSRQLLKANRIAVESEQDSLGAAGGHDDLVGGDVDIDALVVLYQLLTAGEDTCGVAVSDNLLVEFLHGLAGAFGSLDVGLADVEVVNVYASFLSFIRKRD